MQHVQSVFLELDDEGYAPASKLLKLAYFPGGYVKGTGEPLEAVVFIQIGDYDEDTYGFDFKSSESRSFSVEKEDLLRALIALGVLEMDTMELVDDRRG